MLTLHGLSLQAGGSVKQDPRLYSLTPQPGAVSDKLSGRTPRADRAGPPADRERRAGGRHLPEDRRHGGHLLPARAHDQPVCLPSAARHGDAAPRAWAGGGPAGVRAEPPVRPAPAGRA